MILHFFCSSYFTYERERGRKRGGERDRRGGEAEERREVEWGAAKVKDSMLKNKNNKIVHGIKQQRKSLCWLETTATGLKTTATL